MSSHLHQITDPLLAEKEIQLWVKRDDLIHPLISGNKWRKLKYNIQAAREAGKDTLLTFGGAYSNHIAAVAATGHESGFKTIGIIRGGENADDNETLLKAAALGMELHFVSRTHFREKERPEFIANLKSRFGDFYLLPEGGTNTLAVQGCAEIVSEITLPFHYLCCSCGTGGTLAGLIAGDEGHQQVIGFSALKGMKDLEERVNALVSAYKGQTYSNWFINHEYHFGGYARLPESLFNFIMDFRNNQHMLLDPVYTGKMFYGIYDLVRMDYFPKESVIIAIHTGGLQGWNGFEKSKQPEAGSGYSAFL